jgi:hypothetical protein
MGHAVTLARYGIEPFDVGYGASFAAEADSPFDIECEVVEDDGTLRAHHPQPWPRPGRLAFIDGTMRTDARLTRTGPDGIVYTGLAGSWVVGAAIADGDRPLTVDRVAGRASGDPLWWHPRHLAHPARRLVVGGGGGRGQRPRDRASAAATADAG